MLKARVKYNGQSEYGNYDMDDYKTFMNYWKKAKRTA